MLRISAVLGLIFLLAGGLSCGGGSQDSQAPRPQGQNPSAQPQNPQGQTPLPGQNPPPQSEGNDQTPPRQPPSQEPDFSNDPNLVQDVNAIIDQVNQALPNFNQFRRAGALPRSAKVILLGENHVDEKGLVDQVRALKKLAQPGDIVLLEGNSPSKDVWQDCDQIIFKMYATKRWNETHPKYDPDEHFRLQRVLNVPWTKAKKSLRLKSLNLYKLKCNFWDIRDAGKLNLSSLKRRNLSMVNEIKRHMTTGQKIFVLAGYAHLPMGDLHQFKHYFYNRPGEAKQWYKIPSPLSVLNLKQTEYYPKLANGEPQSRPVQDQHGFGSTEDLYGFLRNLNYVELIPRYVLAHPDMCGEACD